MKDTIKINKLMLDPNIRSHWLQYLANKRGDFKTAFCFKNKDGEVCFTKHHTVIHCQETENYAHLMRASHRQIFDEEIVLDFDLKDYKGKYDMMHYLVLCQRDMNKRKIPFKLFKTGSTGYHMHIPIKKDYESERKWARAKSTLISKFRCDALKSSSNVLIALEFAPHWKTGNQKELVHDTTSEDIEYDLSK